MAKEPTSAPVNEPAGESTPVPDGGQPAALPQENIPAAPNPLLGPSDTTIPQGMEKFVGTDGKIDVNKLSESYLESEKTLRSGQTQNAELRQALTAVSSKIELDEKNSSAATPTPPVDTDEALRKLAENPHEFIKSIASEEMKRLGDPLAEQLSLATLQNAHPELKDQKFSDGLKQWMSTLPPAVSAVEGTLDGADYLVREYKKHAGIQTDASPQARPSVTNNERPSVGGRSLTGQRFSGSQIRELIRTNPKEYARLEPAILLARREGRVDND